MATKIKIRRGLASEWSTYNPVLSLGEMGLETDTRKTKFGNGTSTWNDLVYSVDKNQIGLGNVDNTSDANKPISINTQAALDLKSDLSYVDTQLLTKENSLGFTPENIANKNISNGYAGIDSSGKIPVSLLPASLMNLHGQWDASTNTPPLADHGVGDDVGDVYECVVAGTVNFGNGPIEFFIGDWAVYGNDGHWYRSPNSNAVTSVNGYTGSIVLTKSDIGLSSVDNTSDLDKPISNSTQTALDDKSDLTYVDSALLTKVDKVSGKELSTNDFSNVYKSKLDGIEAGATLNSSDASLRDRSTHTGNESALTWNEGLMPSTPIAGLTTYAKNIGGRQMFAQKGKSGVDYSFQPFLARNRVVMHQASGSSTTVSSFGQVAPTASGTATGRNIATTNSFTWQRRVGYVTTTTNNSSAGWRLGNIQYGLGNVPNFGGFHFVARFGISDAALVTGARLFVGLTASTAVLGNADPSTNTNIIGFGMDAADTNLQVMHNDSANPSTKINLGTDFPRSTNTDMYEVALYCPPNGTSVLWEVVNLRTMIETSGTITTDLPLNTQLLAWQIWRHNATTGLSVGIDICSVYIETDN